MKKRHKKSSAKNKKAPYRKRKSQDYIGDLDQPGIESALEQDIDLKEPVLQE